MATVKITDLPRLAGPSCFGEACVTTFNSLASRYVTQCRCRGSVVNEVTTVTAENAYEQHRIMCLWAQAYEKQTRPLREAANPKQARRDQAKQLPDLYVRELDLDDAY